MSAAGEADRTVPRPPLTIPCREPHTGAPAHVPERGVGGVVADLGGQAAGPVGRSGDRLPSPTTNRRHQLADRLTADRPLDLPKSRPVICGGVRCSRAGAAASARHHTASRRGAKRGASSGPTIQGKARGSWCGGMGPPTPVDHQLTVAVVAVMSRVAPASRRPRAREARHWSTVLHRFHRRRVNPRVTDHVPLA